MIKTVNTHSMPLERLDGFVIMQLADVYALISRTTGERCICLPINVQSRGRMKVKLLGAFAACCIPDNCSLVHSSRQNVVASLVPFQCENGTLVLTQSVRENSFGGPNPGVAVVAASGQKCTIALQIKVCTFNFSL